MVALPSFLFTTSRLISGYCGGLSGVHAIWAGADWVWREPGLGLAFDVRLERRAKLTVCNYVGISINRG